MTSPRKSRHVVPVGPFETSDEALTWAGMARRANPAWNYSPDLLEPPAKIETIHA